MSNGAATNKQGQALGEKGSATKLRLMEATRHLLKTQSPMQLTTVAIAKQAKTSSATFYMYFDDIKDIMYALAQSAGEDTSEIYAVLAEPWDASKVEVEHARRFVDAFCTAWARHRAVLSYRNLEADRGDSRFFELRTRYYYPIVERIGNRILAAYPPGNRPRKGDAFAEASVVYAALERAAGADPKAFEKIWGFTRQKDALARVIAHVLGGRAQDDTWYPRNGGGEIAGSRKTVRKRKTTESA